ncbi:MAG: 3-hydroxybenzoate 6-hydroxylase 1 [Pseudomonadota bacterium]|jgi:2-polyprenyl-6-methoxyphenol hydroxylase-like FAD-dependent oxidoreductase
MNIAIVGGGIAGLSFALGLHKRGIDCDVFEAVTDIKEIGVGITLLPHAMRELAELGLQDALEAVGIENLESVFYTQHGQYVYKEARGRHAGYTLPEIGIHRGKLHRILFDAAVSRLGADKVHTGMRCSAFSQNDNGVEIEFSNAHTQTSLKVQAQIAVACDGVNSVVRAQMHPQDALCFAGINTWRGVTVHPPILTGKSYLRIGTVEVGKMVIYPIIDNVDGKGNQLINWVAELQKPNAAMNDWNRPGDPAVCAEIFKDWTFDFLNVPELILKADKVFEYPMVDKNALPFWTQGRVTLMGDAAHPMYPRGSNGSAQALIDARTLADQLAQHTDPKEALKAYEVLRLAPTAKVVETNRNVPPDFIIMKAQELSGGKPFRHIDDLITQDELRQISDHYKTVAGFALTK